MSLVRALVTVTTAWSGESGWLWWVEREVSSQENAYLAVRLEYLLFLCNVVAQHYFSGLLLGWGDVNKCFGVKLE